MFRGHTLIWKLTPGKDEVKEMRKKRWLGSSWIGGISSVAVASRMKTSEVMREKKSQEER
jgi:hypothetical protein